MTQVLQFIGAVVSLIGSIFLFLGALGILRMPDLYNRMQAGTKTTTLGSMMTLLGIGIYRPAWLPQLLIIIAFIVITNPISTHALARAAHFAGVRPAEGTVTDRLREERETEPGKGDA